MSNHPNRNWRRRWRFDTAALVARHESGLVVQFTDAGGALDGRIDGPVPESLGWREDPQLLARLLRQAGEGMMEAVEKEPKH